MKDVHLTQPSTPQTPVQESTAQSIDLSEGELATQQKYPQQKETKVVHVKEVEVQVGYIPLESSRDVRLPPLHENGSHDAPEQNGGSPINENKELGLTPKELQQLEMELDDLLFNTPQPMEISEVPQVQTKDPGFDSQMIGLANVQPAELHLTIKDVEDFFGLTIDPQEISLALNPFIGFSPINPETLDYPPGEDQELIFGGLLPPIPDPYN